MGKHQTYRPEKTWGTFLENLEVVAQMNRNQSWDTGAKQQTNPVETQLQHEQLWTLVQAGCGHH